MSCFTFSLHPVHFPPTSKLPPSPWRECPSSHPWGGYSPPSARQSGSSSLGRPRYPPSQAWGHFRKCPKGSPEREWRRLDYRCTQLSTPVLSGQGQGQGRPSLLHPWELFKTDLFLAHPPPHPDISFRNKRPLLFLLSPKLSTPGNGQEDDDCICTSLSHHSRAHCQGSDGASEPPQDQKPMLTWAYPCPHLSGLTSGKGNLPRPSNWAC